MTEIDLQVSLIGRQHVVFGYNASNRVTISNSEFDGSTSWSATCDGHVCPFRLFNPS